ncbi:MAG: acyl carrier protein [Desulfovibrio sp.]|uniref:acyl carrier protein n=1 Tax=Desulfovibrio sp. TaxID=885 RepID=UPI0025C164DA|nr:acyl carrier protein [Desulfovibrio sp.]MBS6831063.1 acyl carrier protein [Desulfovibrio sp.]
MEEEVLRILKELQPTYAFEEGVDFIEQSYLDSFDVVTLVTELEETFSVSISALDIIPENFSSVKSICALVRRSAKMNF